MVTMYKIVQYGFIKLNFKVENGVIYSKLLLKKLYIIDLFTVICCKNNIKNVNYFTVNYRNKYGDHV